MEIDQDRQTGSKVAGIGLHIFANIVHNYDVDTIFHWENIGSCDKGPS